MVVLRHGIGATAVDGRKFIPSECFRAGGSPTGYFESFDTHTLGL